VAACSIGALPMRSATRPSSHRPIAAIAHHDDDNAVAERALALVRAPDMRQQIVAGLQVEIGALRPA
jgi:hypothetical protein